MIVGYDNKGLKLNWGDICTFEIHGTEYEGMIIYDEEYFGYNFEMKDDHFPSVVMSKADYNSIEKIINVWSTNPGKDDFDFYRELAKNK